ncbi:MAG: fumarate reductase iron-sulfur subunit [Deltaproteobacteria bacterium]|nr:fumarate reductase iron-sulfur subunit [Deltaproteobacteria bacterium]
MGRNLIFHIFRYQPKNPESQPHLEAFHLEETDGMTLFIVLNRILEEQDSTLQFDFCCRAGMCGSCAVLINGHPDLACHTKTSDLPEEITLMPLPVFDLVGDLSVDKGGWFRKMNKRIESWIHTDKTFDPNAPEERMENRKAVEIYELERCIECGCCVAACGNSDSRPDFLGPVALNRMARFLIDPRDHRREQDFFDVVETGKGVFGCLEGVDLDYVCPKKLPLKDQVGMMIRKKGGKVGCGPAIWK